MIGVALKGLWGRKTRSLLTAISIVLGTAMIAGTFVVRDGKLQGGVAPGQAIRAQ